MKINILYRHYAIEGTDGKGRPQWFQYEDCLKNLLKTINDYTDVTIHIIMDGDSSTNFINNYREHVTIHTIEGGSDQASFLEAHKYAKKLAEDCEDTDLFYFLENDYLHVSGWDEKVRELFSIYENLNYVSLYDHNDKYFLPQYDDLVSKIFTTQTHHWRTTPSTCGTYIVNKKILLEDYDIPFTIPGDHFKFIHLNQTRGRFVITPIPGLSTHCMEHLMSPTINWEQI